MRIAQIAPLAESVPPKLYGGTERVVSWLTEELVALGHDVSLFASGTPEPRPNWFQPVRGRFASGVGGRILLRPMLCCSTLLPKGPAIST